MTRAQSINTKHARRTPPLPGIPLPRRGFDERPVRGLGHPWHGFTIELALHHQGHGASLVAKKNEDGISKTWAWYQNQGAMEWLKPKFGSGTSDPAKIWPLKVRGRFPLRSHLIENFL